MPEELTSTEDLRSNEELDQLADGLDVARNSERPMTQEAAPKTPEAKAQDEYEFVHNGKPVKATRDQMIKWAQQGYDYPQKAQKLNQEKAKWEQQRQEWEQKFGVYREIDAYAKQNQEWWNFIQNNWQNRGQTPQAEAQTGQPDPYASKFSALEQKLSQVEPVIQQFVQERQAMHEKQQDEKLDQEVQSIREKHPDLDWNTLDENGKHLELRVLEHAQQNGIASFKAAFRDLLHDELVNRAASQGKIAVAKGIQNRSKLGVLGESPTPQKGMPTQNRNMRTTSYEELEADIREELRRGNFGG